jgi:hypothetical protein
MIFCGLRTAIGDSPENVLIGMPTTGGVGLNGNVAAEMKQQSLMIANRQGMEQLVSGLLAAEWTDGDLSPEMIMERQLPSLGTLCVPYGRSRPIDFDRSHFYVQHLSLEELRRFIEIEGLVDLYGGIVSRPFYENI